MKTFPPMENIKIRNNSTGDRVIFCPIRHKYVVLTPEEWVRQNMLQYLHNSLNYPLELIQVEGAITLNGMTRRCDIVVYDAQVRPHIIIECKKETIALTQRVLDQASRYNIVLQVPYLCITNGPNQICCRVDFDRKTLINIQKLPSYNKKC